MQQPILHRDKNFVGGGGGPHETLSSLMAFVDALKSNTVPD